MEEVKDLRMDQRQGTGAVLEQLMEKIPGYAGYRDREHRREADQKHREFLAKRLAGKKKAIQDVGQILLEDGGMEYLTKVESLTSKVDRVMDRCRHASEGFSSFMDTNVVDTDRLDRVYEHDLNILEKVESLDGLIENFETAADTQDNVNQAIRKVKKGIEDIDSALDTRDKILKGLE